MHMGGYLEQVVSSVLTVGLGFTFSDMIPFKSCFVAHTAKWLRS